jgi:hypothetical protein
MMLFTFPQSQFQDGTCVPRYGSARRLTHYTVTPLDLVTVNDIKFSSSWSLDIPELKDERYTIRPLMKGQLNLAYFELLAGIHNSNDQQVGLCFVELLPGVFNAKFPLSLFSEVA